MTMNELVEEICDQLNVATLDAKARIGRELNSRYRRVTSAIGMTPTRREEVSVAATIGNRLVTFTGIEKLDIVFRKVGEKVYVLDQVTNDEMLNQNVRDEPPQSYSIYTIAPTSITIKLDCTPTTAFTLYANGLADASTLTSNDQPAFPESFHDILIHGVLADEYRRREKAGLAKESEIAYENRLSDLKMFIAKSTYLTIYRGKHSESEGWWDTNSYH